MKKVIFYSFMILAALLIESCHSVSVGGGQEAVLIEQPIIFGHGGVDDSPVSSGQTWVAPSTSDVIYDITPILHTEDFPNMTTRDHNTVSFSAYLKIQIRQGQTPYLHKNFRKEWYENNIKEVFRTLIRNKCSEHDMFALTSDRTIIEKMQTEILKEIQDYVAKLKMPLDILDLQIGQATPPDEVLKETHLTAAQNQNKLTQDARGLAEVARKDADIKKAQADLAYMNAMGMTVSQYLQLRQLEIEKEKVELIKDKTNVSVSFISSSGGGSAGVQPTYQTNK